MSELTLMEKEPGSGVPYLVDLLDHLDNQLMITVIYGDPEGDEFSTDEQIYEILFEQYVAYAVTNADNFLENSEDVFEGVNLQVSRKSAYLDYVMKTCDVGFFEEGELAHYRIRTVFHIIDVVSSLNPVLKDSTIQGSIESEYVN